MTNVADVQPIGFCDLQESRRGPVRIARKRRSRRVDASPVGPPEMGTIMDSLDSRFAVVTAFDGGPVGFRCRFLASLSSKPPLIGFTPAKTSLTWPQIRRTGRFCVNILAGDQDYVGQQFALPATDRFEGLGWTTAPLGTPVLGGVAVWLECTVWAEHDGGDHSIVVGQVQNVGTGTDTLPPLFLCSSYPDA